MKKAIIALAGMVWALALYAQSDNKPYDFPIRPGTEEWNRFTSPEEMFSACQIPEDILPGLTTEALLTTCLNYPVNTVLMMHNTPQQGFEVWKQQFNGIRELLNRKNAASAVLTAYQQFDVNGYTELKDDIARGDYTFALARLEIIAVQSEIVSGMNEMQKKQALKSALVKFTAMESNEIYGTYSLASSGRFIGRLYQALNSPGLLNKYISPEAADYINTGLLTNPKILESIIDDAKKIKTD